MRGSQSSVMQILVLPDSPSIEVAAAIGPSRVFVLDGTASPHTQPMIGTSALLREEGGERLGDLVVD